VTVAYACTVRSRRAHPLFFLLASVSACGGSPAARAPGPPLAFVPMRLVEASATDTSHPIFELRPDGTIFDSVDNRPIGRLAADRILDPISRAPVLVVGPDGTMSAASGTPSIVGRFDANDAFVLPPSRSTPSFTIWVDDAGYVRGLPPGRFDGRFVPFQPAARRTAEAMVVLFFVALSAAGR
jgi:hypothetical protein